MVAFCKDCSALVQLNKGQAAFNDTISRAVGFNTKGVAGGAVDRSLEPTELAHHHRTRIAARHSSSVRSHSVQKIKYITKIIYL